MNRPSLLLARLFTIALIPFAIFHAANIARACSVFSFVENNHVYVAKNYDWLPGFGHGAVYVNKRGVEKLSRTLRTDRNLRWVSRYGSVTFTQMGQEFPLSGMNEAGLTGEILQLNDTQYPSETDPRPALNEAQWLQYQLDNHATVAEVIANADMMRVESAFLGVHYFLCDRSGECGTFEFLDGHLQIHSGARLPIQALTNSTYEESLRSVSHVSRASKRTSSLVPSLDLSFASSLSRFAILATELQARSNSSTNARDFAFATLGKVAMSAFYRTQWRLVHDLTDGMVTFGVRSHPRLQSIRVAAFDYSCSAPALMANLNTADVAERMSPITFDANKALIDQNRLIMSSKLRRLAAEYPFTHTRCVEP